MNRVAARLRRPLPRRWAMEQRMKPNERFVNVSLMKPVLLGLKRIPRGLLWSFWNILTVGHQQQLYCFELFAICCKYMYISRVFIFLSYLTKASCFIKSTSTIIVWLVFLDLAFAVFVQFLRELTLGARDVSCAVSCFGPVHSEPDRQKPLDLSDIPLIALSQIDPAYTKTSEMWVFCLLASPSRCLFQQVKMHPLNFQRNMKW